MIIQSTKVWVLDTWMKAALDVRDGKIAAILPWQEHADYDFGDQRILPGFLDIHCHGAYGWDTNDATPEGLRTWTSRIPTEGVTAFLPTTITQSEQVLTAALENVANVVKEGYQGAEILGVHLEGPYLDQVYKGAQPEQYCVLADVPQFERYLKASDNLIRLVTMATEHDKDYALTHYLVDHGIVVSQGHSGASYEQAAMGIANGAMSMTHVYNGMTKFHHREPGLVGTAFRFREVYGEIICDGNHVHPASINDFFRAKGPDHGIMITDSLMVKSLPAGTIVKFGGNDIELFEDGSAHLVGAGNLAGSTLNVNRGLQIMVEKAEVPWQTAINAVTLNPAKLLGVDDRKGSLQAGRDADIVVIDENYDVKACWCRGRKTV